MLMSWLLLAALCVHAVQCGYLDRVVQYRKHKFIEALKERLPPLTFNGPLPPIPSDVEDKDEDIVRIQLSPRPDIPSKYLSDLTDTDLPKLDIVNVTAMIVPLPAGFVDSPQWDVASVGRLLDLLKVSKAGRRVLGKLRRSMAPTRRWMMSKQLSYKLFPNVNEGNYYESEEDDEDSDEEGQLEELQYPTMMGNVTDDSVVVVANPVEARLPSGHISVAMLRMILEQRAEAGRVMPSTTVVTITWKSLGKKNTPAGDKDAHAEGETTAVGDGAADGATATDATATVADNDTNTSVEGNGTNGNDADNNGTTGTDADSGMT